MPIAKPWRKSGFSLVEAVVVLAVLGVAAAATQSLLAAAFRGSAAGDFKQGVSALSSTLRDRVSCSKTFEHVDLTEDCLPSTRAKPLILRDADGDPITEALEPAGGAFEPLDSSLRGSAKLGNYQLRAYCDRDVKSLVIRYSRPAGAGFLLNPTTKQPLDWQRSSTNPLFGLPERTLCASNLGGTSGKPAGLITTKSVFRRVMSSAAALLGIPVQGPTNARLVKITAKGQNLAEYGSGGESTEDTADIYVLVNIANETSTGYYAVTGGSGEMYTTMFSWNDRPWNAVGGIEGDRVVTADYGGAAAATFQPRFSFNQDTGVFRVDQLAVYAPAQYVFLFEFYGD